MRVWGKVGGLSAKWRMDVLTNVNFTVASCHRTQRGEKFWNRTKSGEQTRATENSRDRAGIRLVESLRSLNYIRERWVKYVNDRPLTHWWYCSERGNEANLQRSITWVDNFEL